MPPLSSLLEKIAFPSPFELDAATEVFWVDPELVEFI